MKLSLFQQLGVLLVLLLLYTGAGSQSDHDYRPNPLYDCAKNCSVPEGACDEEDVANSLCRCDRECVIYGDCCSNAPICDGRDAEENTANQLDGLLQCRSIHLDADTKPAWRESFWMVSACPADWLAGRDDQILLDTINNCTDGSDSLPPVTDPDTGIVYKNEFCAVCHQVEIFQPWGYSLYCNSLLQQLLQSTDVEITAEIVEEYCIPCGFNSQSSPARAARPCFHDSLVNDACLEREELQNTTRTPIDEDQYQELVMQCQHGPISPVVVGPPPTPHYVFDIYGGDLFRIYNTIQYRNQYCAICNGYVAMYLTCINPYLYRDETNHCRQRAAELSPTLPPTTPPPTTPSTFPPELNGTDIRVEPTVPPTEERFEFIAPLPGPAPPFTIFLDVNGDTQIIHTETVSINITTTCPDGEVFDPVDQRCRTTICPELSRGESCAIVDTFVGLSNSTNSSLCDGAPLHLEETEFELLPDNTTLRFRGEIYDIIGYINNSLPIICTDFTQNGTREINVTITSYSYPAAFSIVTYIGCSLSVIGCAFVLLTYSIFKELRTLPGKILMNLAAAILGTCVVLLIGIPLFALADKEQLCHTTAIFLHWLVLCQFSWMTIMSFELARTLLRATRLKPVQAPKIKNQIFLLYMLIGWGLPTIITGVTVIINYTTDYIEYGEDGFCWIGHVASFYIVFLAPVALSVLLNFITFFITAYLLFKALIDQAKLEKQKNTSYVRIYLSAFSITGLTWTVGFVAILARWEWAWYLFIILTSTQGFVICIAFLFTKKVGSLYKEFFLPKISKTFSFRSSSNESTQITSVRYASKGEKVSTVSSQSASGNVSEIQEDTERREQQIPVHYGKKSVQTDPPFP